MNENMKTMNEEQQAANSREAYEAPKCEIIEVQNEGVLCGSGDSYGSSNESFTENPWKPSWDN